MDYKEATSWLFNQIPNYQNQGGKAYKPGLDRIQKFLQEIGNPHLELKVIHVAGTNGKGSVCHMLGAALQSNGYKTGIFSSPHIFDFTERVKINGQFIPEKYVTGFIDDYRADFLELGLSFFEITAALGFKYFRDEKVDFAIIETGLGGRLDATNIVDPILSIITNIGFDHTQFLGNSIHEIAGEKAGIIKPKKPVVLGDKSTIVLEVVKAKVIETRSELNVINSDSKYTTSLRGAYQQTNLLIAEKALDVMEGLGYAIDLEKNQNGLNNVEGLTQFFGRFQCINTSPTILVDVAHNADGVKELITEIKNYEGTLHIVYGGSKDKDLTEVFQLFSGLKANYFLSSFSNSRSIAKEKLAELGENFQLNYTAYDSVVEAYEQATALAKTSDTVVVCGSFFLIADLEFLKERFFQ